MHFINGTGHPMDNPIHNIVIVGGGAAGWITAGLLAAEHNADQGLLAANPKLTISLIESPDVPIIGVGEGTWPSMRLTLQKIGISETEFLLCCDASFKQGSKFINWRGVANPSAMQSFNSDSYLHPFSLPIGQQELNLCSFWLPFQQEIAFADAVCQQFQLSELGFAPKQIATPEYSFVNNYGYHLNASKFSQLLQKHITEKLGVRYIADHVLAIHSHPSGDIASVITRQHGEIVGDLFVDCSGLRSMLLGEHLQVPLVSQQHVLFNDSALAVQMPYPQGDAPIASCTHSTAQSCGWIWDIALPTRRGIGHVYSSAHTSDTAAEQQLRHYLSKDFGADAANSAEFRKLSIAPGHRAVCWKNNCIAIGMAAGFIEPLEASALAMVEWTAKTLSSLLPANRGVMDIVAKRLNQTFLQHWQQIIEFLKLHYVLSQRTDHDYWHDHRESSSIPGSLQDALQLWRYQVPSANDISHSDVLFPAASYQYVLYGMGFQTELMGSPKPSLQRRAQQLFNENIQKVQKLKLVLDDNRSLLQKIRQHGLPKI
jgi:2-polyprenyl-6-methoxyphenol hydroxylase-like FAD-dependent oxidoreductase